MATTYTPDRCGNCGDPVRQDEETGQWDHVQDPRDIPCSQIDVEHLEPHAAVA